MAAEYFDEVEVGDTESFGNYEVTSEEIIEFAEQFDPQPFHLDEKAANESMFGGLVASGWHTASMTMRMLVDNYLNESGAQGAVGVDELRWAQPVRPGQTLSVELEVLEKGDWSDDFGLVRTRIETLADGDVAMSMVSQVLFDRQP